MKYITKAAINRPVTIIVTLVALILFALVSVSDMALQLMPEFNFCELFSLSGVTFFGKSFVGRERH